MDEVAVSKDGRRIAFRGHSGDSWWHCRKPTEAGQFTSDLPADEWVRLTPMTDRDLLTEEIDRMAELLDEVLSGMSWLRARAEGSDG